MSALNIFSITFGGVTIGGSSTDYQLHNPYTIEKSYEAFRVVFAVVITAPDHATLQSRSDFLESTFRRRLTFGDTLSINLNGNAWTYLVGQTLLHVTSSCVKSGDPASDKSFSRLYTVTIQGELPADNVNDAGLRNLEVHVDNSPSSQTTVTFRGTYTASTAGDAVSNYFAQSDADLARYLLKIAPASIFELVKEEHSRDRERTGGTTPYTHVCNFSRQYVELLAPQNTFLGANFNDPEIKDHNIQYVEDVHYANGDAIRSLERLRVVNGRFDCAVDTLQTTNLQAVYLNKIRATIIALFQADFSPRVFCITDLQTAYSETTKRIAASFTFLYQAARGARTVEASYSVAYRESRQINYTYTHQADELSAYADVGWLVLERVFTRRVTVLGFEAPKLRLSEDPFANDAGLFTDTVTDEPGPDNRPGTRVNLSGWNMVSSSSEAVPSFVGDPSNGTQLAMCTLTETVVERFHRNPQRTITQSGGGRRGAITPNG
jgi:hypothetical protein